MANKDIRLDVNALYAEASDYAIEGGKRKYYDDKVKDIRLEYDDDGAIISGLVKGNFDYNVKIKFDENGTVCDYKCACASFSYSMGPCKHIIGAMLAFQEKYPEAELRGKAKQPSDTSVSELVTDFSRAGRVRYMDEMGVVELKPELTKNDKGIFLRLSIGSRKKYLIKDLKRFITDFETGEVRRYGAALELISVLESFNDLGKRLFRFVKSIFDPDRLVSKDTLRLNALQLDALFGLYSGKLIYLSDLKTGGGERIVVPSDTFTLTLNIEAEDKGYKLVCRNEYNIIGGASTDFVVTGTKIYPIDIVSYGNLEKLLKCFLTKKVMRVAREDMPVFYNLVLKNTDHVEYNTEIDLKRFEAPPFKAVLTLDYCYSQITGELKTSYGDVEVDILDEADTGITVRDLVAERGLREALSAYFTLPSMKINDDKKIFELLRYGLARIYNFADIVMLDGMRKLKLKRGLKVHTGIKLSGGLLDVNLKSDEFSEEELKKIYNAAKQNKDYIKLSGMYIDLHDPDVDLLAKLMEIGRGESDYSAPVYYAPYINSVLDSEAEEAKQLRKFLDDLKRIKEQALPAAKLEAVMRPYQITGFRWLRSLYDLGCGGILADDMGLGKSLQSIALISSLGRSKTLIICPTTLILNWIAEFEKFAPEIKTMAIMGSNTRRADQLKTFDEGVLISSYDLIRRDIDLYENIKFDLAIVDEAQYIKNPDTKNAASVKSINAVRRFALTGTPIENSLSELWSIFDFIMPDYLGGYPKFRDEFEQKIISGDERASNKLEALISPFILRRLKSDVLTELPPKIETEIACPLKDEQRDIYMKMLALTKREFRDEGTRTGIDALAALTRLRLICCHPTLIDPEYIGNSAKTEAAIQLIRDGVASGRKILVFSQFTAMLDILRLKLAEYGIGGYLLKGETPKTERMMLVNRFNSDSTPVFFISLRAGGTGLNLVGADMVIHYDPWWNTSVMEQATDRAYRIGQDKPVNVYRLLLEDTVERKIRFLQMKKQKLGQNFVKENEKIDADKILKMLLGDEAETN